MESDGSGALSGTASAEVVNICWDLQLGKRSAEPEKNAQLLTLECFKEHRNPGPFKLEKRSQLGCRKNRESPSLRFETGVIQETVRRWGMLCWNRMF